LARPRQSLLMGIPRLCLGTSNSKFKVQKTILNFELLVIIVFKVVILLIFKIIIFLFPIP